ncbi:MAG TPA: UDP-N-acetylglucosamine--N-acetylmuramyl-(pentapeptide) pyrophosphoryl-undecaprenol N-acetylglucosamine transferase [Candidatus Peribacteria bacterium]|nr:UDP-N-acetylglucosamine--N-acetylmuramyl-(pentapeptide) pyrophosphoryl-undecaprenol N-acetylglucosamine transferase [Candidatus Peribacteria bacterium]
MSPLTIVFCGGGSVGHVAPAVAVARAAMKLNPAVQPLFLCADRADETAFLTHEHLPFRTIPAAKFPRGMSAGWVTFPFVFAYSLIAARGILKHTKPAAVFSKGGYVSAPICIAARMMGIPIVLHESDATGGMSNRLIATIARTVCLGFPEEVTSHESRVPNTPSSRNSKLATRNSILTGNPVRPDIAGGSKDAARRITGFSGRRPVLLVIGGSQGSLAINQAIDKHFEALIDMADVIHLTGANKETGRTHARYWARPFVTEELKHLYALTDVAVSRAGAGTLSELAALGKPTVVVPLLGVAQDHQQCNAKLLESAGGAILLPQERLDELPSLLKTLLADAPRRTALGERLRGFFPADAATAIARSVLDAAGSRA